MARTETRIFGRIIYSTGGGFRIGFIRFATATYVGISHNRKADRVSNTVWVANRDNPILNVNITSVTGSLTIDDYGDLKITYNEDHSIVLYSGHEASNVSAVLLDTGNFVPSEISPPGRNCGKVLIILVTYFCQE